MAKACLDHSQIKQMRSLVEKLTTSGRPVLDEKFMKELKKICRTSDLHVQHAYHLLMKQLHMEHAEIRLSASQIFDELFIRSHAFRELLLANFQKFLELTVETDQHHHPLPPPKAAAQKMKTDTLKAIQLWQEKFGEAYKKLSVGYNYLKTCKLVNFSDIRAQSLTEQRRREEQETRRCQALVAKLEKVRKEISDLQREINDTATEAENCIELIFPKPDSLFTETDILDDASNTKSESTLSREVSIDNTNISAVSFSSSVTEKSVDHSDLDDDEENVDGDKLLQVHGLGSRNYNLQIEIQTARVCLQETEDNRDLFCSLKDAASLISARHLPQIVRWLEVLSKTGGTEAEIKRMIDLKIRLEGIKMKCSEMQLISQPHNQEEESDSDEDLEEVPEKEGFEPIIPSHLRAEYGLEPTLLTINERSTSNEGSTSQDIICCNGKGNTMARAKASSSSTSGALSSATSSQSKWKAAKETTKGKSTVSMWSLKERIKGAVEQDPTSRAASLAKLGIKEDLSGLYKSSVKPATVTSESESHIPTLSYGADLAHWGAAPDEIEAPAIVKKDSLHRFWTPAQVDNEKPSQNDIATVLNRTFHFTGEYVPVKWKCRAKLPNGKLCERMDRLKCPFHGKIIPRDEFGVPANHKDCQKEETNSAPASLKSESFAVSNEKEVPPWLDADLQAEIEAATGHDLGSQRSRTIAEKVKGGKGKRKGKGKGKNKYEGLTDISETKKSTRARLEAKVLNKRALKRVAHALDSADYKRVRDKFGNQFNYSYSK